MKRIFDIVVVLITAAFWMPIGALVATALVLSVGRPIFFTQLRPGLHGRIFKVYKFRTMTVERGQDGRLLPDEERIPRIGRLLRRLSIDELPQLLNVVKGDLSLVGPRPLMIDYLPLYNAEQARRHDVRPGLTGWAQINGRNSISWDEKFALDCWYVDNRSFWLDMKILWITLLKVIRMEGISQAGYATMPPFIGCSQSNRVSKDC